MQINSAKELIVYQKAYDLAMRIFGVSSGFPPEERYALTSQIRRASRSVCLNLREEWAKRRYEAHFVSKLTDCDGENSETDSCLDFARDCHYISEGDHQSLTDLSKEVGRLLGSMIRHPHKFTIPPGRVIEPSDL
jgi:four helix bundle protein